jgi:ADP-ribose diphosphatase
MTSPGIMSETIGIYCGRIDAGSAGGIHGLAGEDEDIRVFTAAREDAVALIARGKILHSPSIIALQWLALNHREIRARWRTDQ